MGAEIFPPVLRRRSFHIFFFNSTAAESVRRSKLYDHAFEIFRLRACHASRPLHPRYASEGRSGKRETAIVVEIAGLPRDLRILRRRNSFESNAVFAHRLRIYCLDELLLVASRAWPVLTEFSRRLNSSRAYLQ